MEKNSLNDNIRFIFSSGSIIFILKILASGIGFIFQIILGRFLGVDDYGLYTIFITCINFLCVFTTLGLDSSLIRIIARVEKKYQKNILKRAVCRGITYFFIFFILSFVFKNIMIDVLDVNDNIFYIILYVTLLIRTISIIVEGFFQGKKKIVTVTVISSLMLNILKLVFFIIMYSIFNNIYTAMISYLFSEGICFILVILIYIKDSKKSDLIEVRYPDNEYRNFIKYSYSLSLIAGASILVQSTDKLMINSIVGTYEVGLYRTAENYVNLISLFASTFVVFWPVISSLYRDGKINILNEIFGYISKVLCFLSIPIMAFITIYSKELFEIFGAQYIQGSNILGILLIGILVDTISGPVGALLNMTNYAKYNLFNMVMLAIINIFLNLVLIPKYGAMGAAIATSFSKVVINILNIIQNKILLKVFPYDIKLIVLMLSGGIIMFLNKLLYNFLENTQIVTMILIIIFNYIIYGFIFIIIIRPNFSELKEKLFNKK